MEKNRIRLLLSENKIREALDLVDKDVDSLFEIGLSLDKALTLNPDNADAWARKGIALSQVRSLEEALTCFDTSLQIDPENVQT